MGGHDYEDDCEVIHCPGNLDKGMFTHLVRKGPIMQPARLTMEAVAMMETDSAGKMRSNACARTGLTEMKSYQNTKRDEQMRFDKKNKQERERLENKETHYQANTRWMNEKRTMLRRMEEKKQEQKMEENKKHERGETQQISRKRRRESCPAPPEATTEIRENPAEMSDYRENIIKDLLQKQKVYMTGDYTRKLTYITNNNRERAIDWIMELHFKYRMKPETLYGCVFLLDRFLAKKLDMLIEEFQTFVTACFLIAAKFEEVDAVPQVDILVQFMGIYGEKEAADAADFLREAEIEVMEVLDFKFNVPSPYQFLLNFTHAAGIPPEDTHFFLAMFFLDCTLMDMQFLQMLPSQRAAVALYLAGQKLKSPIADDKWQSVFNMPIDKVRYWSGCVEKWFHRYESFAVFRKYRRPEYLNVVAYAKHQGVAKPQGV